jgi:short-subunit dehydrogenase
LRASWGGLNILVNNAGIAYYGPTHEMTAEQCRQILSVNLLAPIQLVRELLPLLGTADEAHILNVSSIFGLTSIRKGAVYQSSKFGLVGFSAALRAEYGERDIGVSLLCPGFVRTPLLERFATGAADQKRHRIPAWASTSADRVAAKAIRAIRNNTALVVTPPLARLSWWLTRLSPALIDWLSRQGWRKRGRAPIANK